MKLIKLVKYLIHDLLTNPLFYLRYLVCGATATAVNTYTYHVFFRIIGIPNVISVAMAWTVSTVLCFWGYRLWVFKSAEKSKSGILKEFWSFMGLRLFTCFLEMGIMFIAVDIFAWNHILWKIIACGVSTIINFLASKFFIFKPKAEKNNEHLRF